MTDQLRKMATIHRIQQLQLSQSLISALDDINQAESVAEAIEQLLNLDHQWNEVSSAELLFIYIFIPIMLLHSSIP